MPVVQFGPFAFDPSNQLLRRDGEDLPLPPRALGVLEALVERPGDLVPRQALIDRVWKDAFVTDTSLAEAVSLLRQTLGDDAQAPRYIQTVHRRGYRFLAPVSVVETVRSGPAPAAPASPPAGTHPSDAAAVPSIGGWLLPWTVAALALTLAAVAVWQATTRTDPEPAPVRFTLTLPSGLVFDPRGDAVALSPAGSRVALSACDGTGCRLYQRALDRLDLDAIAGTDDARGPFFSPDGAWIGFFAGGRLQKVAVTGGSPVALADALEPRGAVWTPDGQILFASGLGGGLWRVRDSGGTPVSLTQPREQDGEVSHGWPSLSPDGRSIIFSIATTFGGNAGRLALAAFDRAAAITAWSTLLPDVSRAATLGRDVLVLSHGSDVQARRIDWTRGQITGTPVPMEAMAIDSAGAAQFAAAAGNLVTLTRDESPGAAMDAPQAAHDLVWWVRGTSTALPATLVAAHRPVVATSGRLMAWSAPVDSGRADLWTAATDRGAASRITFDGLNVSPAWSPDGRRLVFARGRGGRFELAAVEPDGGAIASLPSPPANAFPRSVSTDGTVASVAFSPASRADIWLTPGAGAPPRVVVSSPFDDCAPALSPDGRLLAYQSDEGGRWDIYVLRPADGRRIMASTTGGVEPFFAADGATLFYRTGSTLMAVDLGTDLTAAAPREVVTMGGLVYATTGPAGSFVLERDRRRASTHAVIAIGWDRALAAAFGPREPAMPR